MSPFRNHGFHFIFIVQLIRNVIARSIDRFEDYSAIAAHVFMSLERSLLFEYIIVVIHGNSQLEVSTQEYVRSIGEGDMVGNAV